MNIMNREKIMKENPDYEFIEEFVEVPSGKKIALVETRVGDGEHERHEQFHILINGTKAYDKTFDYAGPFDKEGLALVRKNGEKFFINPEGERI